MLIVRVRAECGYSTTLTDQVEIKAESEDVDMEPIGSDVSDQDAEGDQDDDAIVAVGAPFLAQEWSGESSMSSGSTEIPSKVVALPIGQLNAQVIEDWQNQLDSENDEGGQDSNYAAAIEDNDAQLFADTPQLNNIAMGNDLMFGNGADTLFDQSAFDNMDFGNIDDPGFDLGNLDFTKPESGAPADSSMPANYGMFNNPFDSNFPQTAGFGGFNPTQGAPQYGAANNGGGTNSMNYNPSNQAYLNNMGGPGFGSGFGSFGQGMGYLENPYGGRSLADFPLYNYDVTANTPKGGDRNANKKGYGAASSSQAQQGGVSRNGRRHGLAQY